MLIYKVTGRKLSDNELSVTKEEIDEMIKSVSRLQVKYKEIIDLIENDPELKKYVENRMNEIKKK
jgi:FKBP-type peptidyl-prolyl cis-trans isomerase (trigger factor)